MACASDLMHGDDVDGSDFVELEDNLKCTLCGDEYNSPKVLQCRHTFCEKCLKEYIVENTATAEASHGFPCPSCSRFHAAPDAEKPVDKWAELLDDNDVYKGMLDIIKTSDDSESTPREDGNDNSNRLKKPEVTKQDSISFAVPDCSKHGKCLEFYCKSHARQLCTDCVILKHRLCQSIVKCDKVVTSHLDKIEDLGKSADANKAIAEGLGKEIGLRLDHLTDDRERVKGEIRRLKDEIIAKLNRSETELFSEIDSECDSRVKLYDERLKCCDKIKKTAKESTAFLKSLQSIDCPEYVVHAISTRDRASESELALLQEMMNTTFECRLNLTRDSAITSLLAACKHFGHVTVSNTIIEPPSVARKIHTVRKSLSEDKMAPPQKLELDNTINALLPGEKRNNWITDVCFMKDDRIILIDRNNKRVKLYSKLFKFLDFIKLRKSTLFAVSPISDDEIAVTMPVKSMVQFLSTSGDKLSTSRTLDTKQPCYGIAYDLKQLFVCCSQFQNMPCCIKVFDMSDAFLRDIIFDVEGSVMFTSLENAFIAVNPIDSQISVVDQRSDRHTIVTFDLNGTVKSRDPMPYWIDKVRGLAYLDSNLFLALENRTLCTLADIGREDSKLCEVETSVALRSPFGVAVNSSRDKVAVTQAHPLFNFRENNMVRIFTSQKLAK